MPRCFRLAIVVGVLASGVLLSDSNARAAEYLPPPGKLFAGVGPGDPAEYEQQTQAHVAVLEDYIVWSGNFDWFLARADAEHMRAMLSLMPNVGGHEYITPGQIMRGGGDAWLIELGQALAVRGRPTYVRIMAEMNGWWNPYAAFNQFGKPRPDSSTRDFRQAWRRIVVILRGGAVSQIDAHLRGLGMVDVRTDLTTLPVAPVAFVWNPQTAGAPDVRRNSPQSYYPGDAYVDWVGTDFFSRFPNWAGLNRFYDSGYRHKPFAFGEWGVWGRDAPRWTKRFFKWVRAHSRVRMLIYYQGYPPRVPFDLARFGRSRAVIQGRLRGPRFAQFPSEWAPFG